ncbi:MAG: prepilin-type N-terminal cleavage/methylation domain-containing protein [Cyanobacteria bacterium]|nr:prepilin-type N-terminal cleavage/methylation domain-containing protein [Cyanobacteriota bacterium]
MREEHTLPQKRFQFRYRQNDKGLTLLEISIGLLIMLILVAVTAPKMTTLEASAERDVIKDFVPRLYTASAIYESRYGFKPDTFRDFVTSGPRFNGGPYTISTFGLSTRYPNNANVCLVQPYVISCNTLAFRKWWLVRYNFRDPYQPAYTPNQYNLYVQPPFWPYKAPSNTETW